MNLPDFFTCYDICELQKLHTVVSEKYKDKFYAVDIVIMCQPVDGVTQYTLIDRNDLEDYSHYYGEAAIGFEGTMYDFVQQDFSMMPRQLTQIIHHNAIS
jgi:hypothetical protein